MILLADSEGPNQTDLGLRYPHMPGDTFSDGSAQVELIHFERSVKIILLPSKTGLLLEANSFIFGLTPFQKGIDVQKGKQEVTKDVSFVKNGGKSLTSSEGSIYFRLSV